MALLTRSGITTILRRILETGGLTDQMETDVRRLQDDFDEREGILSRYGETYNGEDRDEYEWVDSGTSALTPSETSKDWETEYKELYQKYLDRFFQGTKPVQEDGSSVDEQEDNGTKSLEDLLYE